MESMKYKLFATDQVIAAKQRKFKTALMRRLELIFNFMNLKANVNPLEADYKKIEINFGDNKPYNELDNVRMVKELLGTGASRTLAFSKLRGLEDVEGELIKQEEEASIYGDIFGGVDGLQEDGEVAPEETEDVR